MFFTSGRMTAETIVVDPEKLLFSDCGFKLWIFDNQSGNKTSDSRRSTAGAMSAKKKAAAKRCGFRKFMPAAQRIASIRSPSIPFRRLWFIRCSRFK